MFEFTPNVNRESMERACAEYQNQQLVADNEICRAWTLDVMFTNNPHEVHITRYYRSVNQYKAHHNLAIYTSAEIIDVQDD